MNHESDNEGDMKSNIFGYFDAPGQSTPAFDPGLNAPCPFCTAAVGDGRRVVTISLRPDGNRSYFYRAHKDCYEQADPDEITNIESIAVDELPRVRK